MAAACGSIHSSAPHNISSRQLLRQASLAGSKRKQNGRKNRTVQAAAEPRRKPIARCEPGQVKRFSAALLVFADRDFNKGGIWSAKSSEARKHDR